MTYFRRSKYHWSRHENLKIVYIRGLGLPPFFQAQDILYYLATNVVDKICTMKKIKGVLEEYEEPEENVNRKVRQLARLINQSKQTVVYTGAGISTAADIPDYRGPKGVWTLAFQNKTIERNVDMIRSNPTFTHMFLKELYKRGKIHHILSQNCDGLHLRSGLPQSCLSEVHGDMYIEVCHKCEPPKQYIRPFDCTKKSAFKQHATGRKCDVCNNELLDTIVHFGEIGKVGWPLNWQGTHEALDDADLIICIGSSLNVLKHYKFLWPEQGSDTKLVIINLQWTAKDKAATFKINGKCDDIMRKLSDVMKIESSPYCRTCDPVLSITAENSADLMNALTDCSCGNPRENISSYENGEDGGEEQDQPGWWAAEIARMKANTPMVAKSPSPELHESGIYLRKRKAVVIRGRRKKGKLESDFEKDVRLAVLDLINSVSGESYTTSRRGRGRPKKYYCLSIEKEGSFKFNGVAEETAKIPAKEERPPDFDFDADEAGSESDSDESHDGDPSFKIPKQMLAKTFWSGPARKKRGESGESKEWDLLPKRTRKVATTVSQSNRCTQLTQPTLEPTSFLEDDQPFQDNSENSDVEKEEASHCSSPSAEEHTSSQIDTETVKEEFECVLQNGMRNMDNDFEEAPSSSQHNNGNLTPHQIIARKMYKECSPLTLDTFPASSYVSVRISGYIRDKKCIGQHNSYVLPLDLLRKLRDFVNKDTTLLTGVADFIENYKQDEALAGISSKELIAVARRLRDGRSVVNDAITFALHYGANGTTVNNSGAEQNGSTDQQSHA